MSAETATATAGRVTHPLGGAPMLDLVSVSKTFAGTRVLREVDLTVDIGEIHAVVGHNGSGKSTLVKILAGYHRPDPGWRASVAGSELALGEVDAAERAGIRFVHQDLGLVGSMDAVDNFHLGHTYPRGRARLLRWRAARRDTVARLAELGCHFDVGRPVAELTSVQRSSLAIARALRDVASARLLVLDEPTAALPRQEIATLLALMTTLREQGLGILFISHHLDEVFDVADRISVLRDGRTVESSPRDQLDEQRVIELMVGHPPTEAGEVPPRGAGHTRVLVASGISSRPLAEVSLTVDGGEIVGVAGTSGSGREELAPAIFGGKARSGRVEVAGRPLPAHRPDLAVRLGLGCLPADRAANAVVAPMSVLENLHLVRLPWWRGALKVNSARERRRARTRLTELQVRPPDERRPIATLSGGNQQKVVLGRWLDRGLKALILDEPTQGVDIVARAQIHDTVRRLARQEDVAVLVCSSDTDELAELCDRVLILRHGRVVEELAGDGLSRDRIDARSLVTE